MASKEPDPIELSLVVPLGFVALLVLTVTWFGSILKCIASFRDAQPVVADAAVTAPTPVSKGKKQKAKKAETAAVVSSEAESTSSTTSSDKMKAIAVLMSWALFIIFLGSDMGMGQLSSGAYDPYKILNVTESVTKAELKRIYRDLSKEYHPDRLTGKSAEEKAVAEHNFLTISKAYKTLTNEESMKNWIEFGHPDGPRSISVNVGIPAWMKNPENAASVMLVYLGVFGGVGYVIWKKYGSGLFEDEDAKKEK